MGEEKRGEVNLPTNEHNWRKTKFFPNRSSLSTSDREGKIVASFLGSPQVLSTSGSPRKAKGRGQAVVQACQSGLNAGKAVLMIRGGVLRSRWKALSSAHLLHPPSRWTVRRRRGAKEEMGNSRAGNKPGCEPSEPPDQVSGQIISRYV